MIWQALCYGLSGCQSTGPRSGTCRAARRARQKTNNLLSIELDGGDRAINTLFVSGEPKNFWHNFYSNEAREADRKAAEADRNNNPAQAAFWADIARSNREDARAS